MREQDRAGFANAMVKAALTLGTERPGEQRLRAYWDALESYPLDMIEEALEMAVRTETFYPVPATILANLGYIHEERNRHTPDDKVSDWERDRRLHPGEYYTPEEIPGVMAEIKRRLGIAPDFRQPPKRAEGE